MPGRRLRWTRRDASVAPSPRPERYTPSRVPNVNAVDLSMTPSNRNQVTSSASAMNPAIPYTNAHPVNDSGSLVAGAIVSVLFEGVPGCRLMRAPLGPSITAAAAAQARLKAAASHSECSSPRRGSSTHVLRNAPDAAPSVFHPYSDPTTRAVISTLPVSARASSGSDRPMKKVGHSRLTRSTAAARAGVAARYGNSRYSTS